MTTEFERWMEVHQPEVLPDTQEWYRAESIWQARGQRDADIARELNCPKLAGVIASRAR